LGNLVIEQFCNLGTLGNNRSGGFMKRDSKIRNYPITRLQNPRERGYILITLMLFVALLTIAALAILPEIRQQIRRDQEEEMRHRGTQYMRAIQHFYKKNSRYPARIEELENTNNLRFLRKRYKDLVTGKDFKILRLGDKELSVLGGAGMGVGLGAGQLSGQVPGQQPFGAGQAQITSQGPSQGQFAGGGVQNILNRQPGGLPQAGGGDQSGSGTATAGAGDNSDASENNPTNQVSSGATASGPLQANSGSGNGPLVLGGGPILGVTSLSKDKSIREFGDKIKHYNEWLFVYDPTADRGGLIYGPVVPNAVSGGMGTPAGMVANQSQGGASSNQPKTPTPPAQPQNPMNQEMPPEQ
jgi:type II secretory pathway pseudopilin PulG